MKVNKASLVEFVDSAIKRLEREHVEKRAEEANLEDKARNMWEKEWGAKWDAALENTRKVRKVGGPVTEDLFPNKNRYDHPYYSWTRNERPFEPPSELLAIKALVKVIVDDEIDLRMLSSSDMRTLFKKYAAK